MNFLRPGTEPRPYAANSTGRLRGTLRLGTQVRRVQVYEAVGEARAISADLNRAIRDYLRDNLQDSASFVVFSLFMVGKSPDRTKPIVMLVSDDKRVRTEAFRMIKEDSAIMEDFPGFALGHMALSAEYENLRPLGSPANPTTVNPDSTSFFVPDETVDVLVREPIASRVRRLAAYSQGGTIIGVAVAEGVFTYKGRYFLHSARHSLLPAQQAQSARTLPLTTASDTSEDEGECEIMGLSDDEEEEDELVDITSRGSASPVESGWGSAFDRLSVSQTLDTEYQDSHLGLQSRIETPKILPEAETARSNTPWTKVGHVALSSALLDSAFVQIDTSLVGDMVTLRFKALESYHDYIETAPSDTAIYTSTPNNTIDGTLSGTPSFVRLPGSKIFQEVYTAMLNRPLVPGDCGSWIKNAMTGKFFGHVIAGSPKTGLVLLIPASRVFAGALDALSACDSADSADVGKLVGFKAKADSLPVSGLWPPTTATPPRRGEGIHAFPTHNEEETSGQSKFDKHGKTRLGSSTLGRLAQDQSSLTSFFTINTPILPTYAECKARLLAWLDQLPQSPTGRGSLHQHETTDVDTPDIVADDWSFFDHWVSPEERDRIVESRMNPTNPSVPNTTVSAGKYIPARLLASERILPASFLTGSADFVNLPNVLFSSQYEASYIFAETLTTLGHWFIPVKTRTSRNPLGGLLTPIGITTLCMRFTWGTRFEDTSHPFFVTFLVLNGSVAENGVMAIIGKPDIERTMGPRWLDLDDATSS